MRRPFELLPWRILHAVDPKERHRSYILTELRALFASRMPCSIHRLILAAFQTTPSFKDPSGMEGSMSVTASFEVGCRGRTTARMRRNGSSVRQFTPTADVA